MIRKPSAPGINPHDVGLLGRLNVLKSGLLRGPYLYCPWGVLNHLITLLKNTAIADMKKFRPWLAGWRFYYSFGCSTAFSAAVHWYNLRGLRLFCTHVFNCVLLHFPEGVTFPNNAVKPTAVFGPSGIVDVWYDVQVISVFFSLALIQH